jgi:hypothetical protein
LNKRDFNNLYEGKEVTVCSFEKGLWLQSRNNKEYQSDDDIIGVNKDEWNTYLKDNKFKILYIFREDETAVIESNETERSYRLPYYLMKYWK